MKEVAFEFVMIFLWLGMLLGKSSLEYFKFPKVGLLTLSQFVVYLGFFLFGVFYSVPIWVLAIFSLACGLFNGCCYSNVIYMILNDNRIPRSEKELALNVNTMIIDFAIFMNGVSGYLFNLFVPQ